MKIGVKVECCRDGCAAVWEGWAEQRIKVTQSYSATYGASDDYEAVLEMIEAPDGWRTDGCDLHDKLRFVCPEHK